MKSAKEIKKIVKKKYGKIAADDSGCGCSCGCASQTAREIGYSAKDLEASGGANLGLGCGNPVGFGKIKPGDTVLDLGSGAGIDCFLASKKVGESGKVIGIDMTEEMVKKSKEIAKRQKIKNVEFFLGEIEKLPLKNNSIDIIVTNCVINLTPDKLKSFKEAYRVLKPGGSMYLSDIVLLEDLSKEQKEDESLISGCVAGALLKNEYLDKLNQAGFKVNILFENKEISKQQYKGIALESITIEAKK